jgi:hypothetical protein
VREYVGTIALFQNSLRIAVLISLFGAMTGQAATGAIHPLDPVPGHRGLSYFNLMKLVASVLGTPTASGGAAASQIGPYRYTELRQNISRATEFTILVRVDGSE